MPVRIGGFLPTKKLSVEMFDASDDWDTPIGQSSSPQQAAVGAKRVRSDDNGGTKGRKSTSTRLYGQKKRQSRRRPSSDDESDAPFAEKLPHVVPTTTTTSLRHKPGDSGFSLVARPEATAASSSKKYDESLSVGDQFWSGRCRCLRCELLAFGQLCQELRNNPTGGESSLDTIILVDLDNWGWPEMTDPQSLRLMRAANNLSDRLVVWAFYGACFGRHFGATPEDALAESQKGSNTDEPPPSLLHAMESNHRLLLSPCGGHKQAVDLVIEEMVELLMGTVDEAVVVLSRDRGLLSNVRTTMEPFVGDKGQQQLSRHTFSTAINVRTLDGALHRVWGAIGALGRSTTAKKKDRKK